MKFKDIVTAAIFAAFLGAIIWFGCKQKGVCKPGDPCYPRIDPAPAPCPCPKPPCPGPRPCPCPPREE